MSFIFVSVISIVFFIVSHSDSAAQSVIVDGTTMTSTSINADGSVDVQIAPSDINSISHNKFQDFSVGLPGVNLDNRAVGASTIINEVTSNKISNINGPLNVLGSRADIIIANPNGLTVNGGRFNNTGNVALTTGDISLNLDGTIESRIRGGEINIGSEGLSGEILELDLIAKKISINGLVGTIDNGITNLNISGGDSDVTFSPNRPFPEILPWASIRNAGGISQDAVSIDITRRSSLNSGSIRMVATDAGAGVRLAGGLRASNGGFTLLADGRLEVNSAQIESQQAVDITTQEIKLSSQEQQTTVISRESGIVLETNEGNIDLGNSRLEAETIASTNLSSSGAITLLSAGDIQIGQEVSAFQTQLKANQSGTTLFSNGDISLTNAQISSDDDLVATSTGKINISGLIAETADSVRLLSESDLTIMSSQINAVSDITLTASKATFGSQNDASLNNKRTEIIAQGGLFIETTSDDFMNYGGLLQAGDVITGEPRADGALTVISAGDVFNHSITDEYLGVLFANQDDLSLQSQKSIINDNGRFFSNSDIRIFARESLENKTRIEGETDNLKFERYFGKRRLETLGLKRNRNIRVIGNLGQAAINNELGLVLAIGDINVNAENIINDAGDFTGRDLTFIANENFQNSARRVGSVNFKQRCGLFCSSSGSSTIQALGGTISSSNTVSITANEKITLTGGSIVGTSNVSLESPIIESSALSIPILVERPSSFTGFFKGRSAWLSNTFASSQLASTGGNVNLNGSVSFDGADIFAAQGLNLLNEEDFVNTPLVAEIIGRENIGLLGDLF